MRAKDSLSDLIGKTIRGAIVAQYPDGSPHSRMFLTFSDGTAFEFWEDAYGLQMAGELDDGYVDQLVEMLERRDGAVVTAFRPKYEDPNEPQRDLLTDSC